MMQHLSESTAIIRQAVYRAVPRPSGRPQLRVLQGAPRPSRVPGELYTASFGFVLDALVNERTRCVPLLLDDTAELELFRRVLGLVARSGGFDARFLPVSRLEARIRLTGVRAAGDVTASLRELRSDLSQRATRAVPPCARGGEPVALELLPSDRGEVSVRLFFEATGHEEREAALHDAARAIAPLLMRAAGVRPSVRVCNTSTERARVSCRIRQDHLLESALSGAGLDGRPPTEQAAQQAVERAVAALASGASAGAVAAAHNLVVEQGIAAVALALGNAPGRVTGRLEQYAGRFGDTAPLCSWRSSGDAVEGQLELPLELATHGRWARGDGALLDAVPFDAAPDAFDAIDPARDIALLAACIGMAASLVGLADAVRVRALDVPPSPTPSPARRDRSRKTSTPSRRRS